MINYILCSLLVFGKSLSDDNATVMTINDNAFEIEHLLYGDITKMNDMFLPPFDNEISETEVDESSREEENKYPYNFDYLDTTDKSLEIVEFNDITKSINNVTRRWYGKYKGHEDAEDPKWWLSANIKGEDEKKRKLHNMNLQWVMHTRFQVKKVLMKKNDIRTDKRYRIGYLVNRLKRLKFEQQKIVSYAVDEDKMYYRSLLSHIRLYEKMVHCDVDITDTVNLIRDIDKERDKPARNQIMPPGSKG